jgi:type 1 glutamine amidotransferase
MRGNLQANLDSEALNSKDQSQLPQYLLPPIKNCQTNKVPMLKAISFLLTAFLLCACNSNPAPASAAEKIKPPHIVFVTGDEEYRSEESMPMLAAMVERELGATTEVLFSLDSNGIVNPNINDNIPGLEALKEADMMVLFLRWRELPDDQLQHILDFAESGKPMAGFRTSTHSFLYKDDPKRKHLNDDWPTAVFGQQWITHHGHFDDGHDPLTMTAFREGANSPILNGVSPFEAYSWLYHTDGGDWNINPKTTVLMDGKSLRSKHEEGGRLEKFPMTNPVVWTNDYKGARVFFTTLGHPFDWKSEQMRKLAINGIAWALEKDIPEPGFAHTLPGSYDPNNSGFGEKFKQGLRPADFMFSKTEK